ncbi:NAD-dependent epimerase/dehydratase family protein [Phnomibacter sp. MR]|uniref:NAD-dependent epimerase/dehydratase family protein n=1 Tax=Phnomibacter sp. MR TaxID=3042318 RepID=UPI003A80EAC4
MLQTILGANGIIAKELAISLAEYPTEVRLVSRQPKPVLGNEMLQAADLLNAEQTMAAVAGSHIVYLTAGLPYNYKVWQQQWPVVMQNTIDACIQHQSKLVFFDNVYAYGEAHAPMTESTPYAAVSKKGVVRKQVLAMIEQAVSSGKLQALIARSADFYGPHCNTSFLNMMVMQRHIKGKKAQWMLRTDKLHSFTYTPDAGKATAMLGNSSTAYNQVWHLPTASPALTAEQWMHMSAALTGAPTGIQSLPMWMMKALGVFIEPLKESIELSYQTADDYVFDSSKFERAFSFQPTAYATGLAATIAAMKGGE